MAFLPSLFGSSGKVNQLQRFNPQQQQAMSKLLSSGLAGLQNLQQFNFEPIAQQARSQFQQQTIPSIAERFTSLGNNALSSPAFASQLGAAGAGLEESLAALQAEYGLQQQGMQQDLLKNLLNFGLAPQTESFYKPGNSGLFGGLAQSGASMLPLLLRLFMGGI
jgi:hypothetical protein